MPRDWFVRTASGELGPVSTRRVNRWIAAGKLGATSSVRRGQGDWTKAKYFFGLVFDPEYKRWFLKTNRRIIGPLSLDRLKKFAFRCQIRPNTSVTLDRHRWIRADQVPGVQFHSPSEPRWFVLGRENERFSLIELCALADEGVLSPTEQVSLDSKRWFPVTSIAEIDFATSHEPIDVLEDVTVDTDSVEMEIQCSGEQPAVAEIRQDPDFDSAPEESAKELAEESAAELDANHAMHPSVDDLTPDEQHQETDPAFEPLSDVPLESVPDEWLDAVPDLSFDLVPDELLEPDSDDQCESPPADLVFDPEETAQDDSESDDPSVQMADQLATSVEDPETADEPRDGVIATHFGNCSFFELANVARRRVVVYPFVSTRPPRDVDQSAPETPEQSSTTQSSESIDTVTEEVSSSQRRLACFETFFGASPKSHSSKNHEAEPEYEFTVVEYGPTKERQFSTLITSGLSDYRLPEPDVDQLEVPSSWSCRIEMILYVQTVEPRFISLLQFLGQSILQAHRWIGYGTVVGNGSPPAPIFQHSHLSSFAFLIPLPHEDFFIKDALQIGGERVCPLWVVPISAAERQLIERHGVSEFCRLCDERCDPLVLTPDRPCYLTDFGRTVRSPSFSINPR